MSEGWKHRGCRAPGTSRTAPLPAVRPPNGIETSRERGTEEKRERERGREWKRERGREGERERVTDGESEVARKGCRARGTSRTALPLAVRPPKRRETTGYEPSDMGV